MLIPEELRKIKLLSYLKFQFKPVATLWSAVLLYRTDKLREATITGETNRLETALQEKYGNAGIYIIQPTDYLDAAWIYKETEPHFEEWDYLESEAHEPTEYDYLETEYDPDYDFIVRVPEILVTMQADMRIFLKKYIMAGKRYKIETY